MTSGSKEGLYSVRETIVGMAKGIIRHYKGDHGVSTISYQEGDKVVVGIGGVDVGRVNRRGVSNVNVVFFSGENEGIANGVTVHEVKNAGVGNVPIHTRTSSNGAEDVSITGVGRVPVFSSPKEDRKGRQIGHGWMLIAD